MEHFDHILNNIRFKSKLGNKTICEDILGTYKFRVYTSDLQIVVEASLKIE